jgi:ankyrin repeat protein
VLPYLYSVSLYNFICLTQNFHYPPPLKSLCQNTIINAFHCVNTKHSLDTFWFLLQACWYLLAAVKSGAVNAVKLFAKSAKYSCATNDDIQYTPLQLAAAIGRVDIVRVLLDSGASVGRTNHKGWTALHVAAFHGQLEVCRLLLDRGAYINAVTWRKKYSPLHSAARKGHLSVVKLLVERGVNIRHKNADSLSARALAQNNGHTKVASWLQNQYSG